VVQANLPVPVLIERSLSRLESQLTDMGALVAYTGARTGRSPKDRFIVRDATTEATVNWGSVNQPVDVADFDVVWQRVVEHLNYRELFVTDGEACADSDHRLRVRVVAEKAWHALFARCLFLRPSREELVRFQPDWHILVAADCRVGCIRRYRLFAADRVDCWDSLRGRNQKIRFLSTQFCSAAPRRLSDALFGQRWHQKRCRAVLWTLRHG
jgi:hypothetical protein